MAFSPTEITLCETKIADPGYTPAKRDVAPLCECLAFVDETITKWVERALLRVPVQSAREALKQFPSSSPPKRERLCYVVGKCVREIADTSFVEELKEFLLHQALIDPHEKTARYAAQALSFFSDESVEDALMRAWQAHSSLAMHRVLARSLGQCGGKRAHEFLQARHTTDAELTRLIAQALIKIERTQHRGVPSRIRMDVSILPMTNAVFWCRTGLEQILCDEIESARNPSIIEPGRIECEIQCDLNTTMRYRTMLRFGLSLGRVAWNRQTPDIGRIVEKLSDPAIQKTIEQLTEGRATFRIEWVNQGPRRKDTWAIAQQMAQRAPRFVNDPTESAWEVCLTEMGQTLAIDLIPLAITDNRFDYRRALLPAASHPTIAAALAQVAGVRADDIVWDPFVGSGLELIERGLLGPYRWMFGTDTDGRAIRAATENIHAAALKKIELHRANALEYVPQDPVTLIITNPPYGRRVALSQSTQQFLIQALRYFSSVLAPDGRIVWLCPVKRAVHAALSSLPLELVEEHQIDLDGMPVALQHFIRRSSSK